MALSRSTSMPHGLVQRARLILASAEGLSNQAVAERVGLTPNVVGKWRRRFREAGVTGLHDELRPGRPRTYSDEKVATLINHAARQCIGACAPWRTRRESKSTVQRWFTLFGVHLTRTFKLSRPLLHRESPGHRGADNAMVLCVDEKSQTRP